METIIVSAMVAGITTLLIEYFAKPHLEKRKKRIIRSFDKNQSILEWVQSVNFLVGRWSYQKDSAFSPEMRYRLFDSIQAAIKKTPIDDLSGDFDLNQHVYQVISSLLSAIEAWKIMFEAGYSDKELEDFLTSKVIPLFDLAEESLSGLQFPWLPKFKIRRALLGLLP